MSEDSARENDEKKALLEARGQSFVVEYCVRRSARAKRLSLTLNHKRQVVVVLPDRCSEKEGLDFMREKSAWIKKYLSRPRSQETLYDYLLQQKSLSLEGRQVPLSIVTNEKRSAVHYSRKTPVVVVGLDAQQDREEVLVAALLGLAKRVLVYQTLLLASNNGLEVKRVTVRDQSKRWGSCSARKTISLNWRLLLLPTEIHDYVILHELAHLKEMNHSPRFWQALTSLDPAAREHDRQLAVLGRRIMELGRREET